MATDARPQSGLPLGAWVYWLLGIPTFYMPAVFGIIAFWGLANLATGQVPSTPTWLEMIGNSALFVTFALWPVYLGWIVFSKRLSWSEKLCWFFCVIFVNVAGMPMFFVFILRRYLQLEGSITARDKKSLDRFLDRYSVDRDSLTTSQLETLHRIFRRRRLARFIAIPTGLAGCLAIYISLFQLPHLLNTTIGPVRNWNNATASVVISDEGTLYDYGDEPTVNNAGRLIDTMMAQAGIMSGLLMAFPIIFLATNIKTSELAEFLKRAS